MLYVCVITVTNWAASALHFPASLLPLTYTPISITHNWNLSVDPPHLLQLIKLPIRTCSDCLVSQMLPDSSLCLLTSKYSSDLLLVLQRSTDPQLWASLLKARKDSLPHPVKLPIHFIYLSTCLNVDVLSTPASVYNKPAVILTYPCVLSCLLTSVFIYIYIYIYIINIHSTHSYTM